MASHPHISVVSPVYRAASMVSELVRRISENVETISPDYEIILVNDASPDDSWNEILKQCQANPKVKGLNLSRNFGQYYAITAGLAHTSGDWIVTLDCDLQDRPEEIPNLYAKAQEGHDIVYARRAVRHDTRLKKLSSSLYHYVYYKLSDIHTDKSIANFGIYKRTVIDAYNQMPEKARSFTSLLDYLGFDVATVDVQHDDRMEGSSSYNLRKLLKISSDAIIANSNKPLRISIYGGLLIAMLAFVMAVYNVLAYLCGWVVVQGYTTTIFTILFMSGLIMCQLGMLGIYIGKIFDQVKDRPIYVVKDKVNF
ncbi:MAG: glycosyltransferase family 2 protein [Paludibacteraceae bacterium]|nr:glycosyltransferase family 2 protein [Paludibacteraceae bacterium]